MPVSLVDPYLRRSFPTPNWSKYLNMTLVLSLICTLRESSPTKQAVSFETKYPVTTTPEKIFILIYKTILLVLKQLMLTEIDY